jgi:predicted small lipoprotein YifL
MRILISLLVLLLSLTACGTKTPLQLPSARVSIVSEGSTCAMNKVAPRLDQMTT